jgi:hypothetical protein
MVIGSSRTLRHLMAPVGVVGTIGLLASTAGAVGSSFVVAPGAEASGSRLVGVADDVWAVGSPPAFQPEGWAETGERSPTSQRWPKGSMKAPWRWVPQGIWWSRIGPREPSAPAATARATKASGSSTKTSMRTVLVPASTGVGPAVALGLAQEQRRTRHVEPDHRSPVPQLGGAERLGVPGPCRPGVGHRQHHRDHGPSPSYFVRHDTHGDGQAVPRAGRHSLSPRPNTPAAARVALD